MSNAEWSVSIYKKTKVEERVFNKLTIKQVDGFFADFIHTVPARFISWHQGNYRIGFKDDTIDNDLIFHNRLRYCEYGNRVYVLNGKLKGKSKAI